MKGLILSLIFVFALTEAFSQCITAPRRRGCVPFSVKIDIVPGSACDSATQKRFNFGTVPPGFFIYDTFTYSTPGTYTFSFSANFSIGGQTLVFPGFFEALSLDPPVFSVLRCEGQQVRVRIDGGAYEQYVIDYGDGSPNDIINSPTVLGPLHTYANTQQRTIVVTGNYVPGNCGASSSRQVTPLGSISVPVITRLRNSQGKNTIDWSTQAGIPYVIYRDGLAIDTLTASSAQLSYTDAPPDGGLQSFCYQVASVDGCLALKNSNTVCSITALSVVAENDQNTIRWKSPATGISDLQLIRADIGNIFSSSTIPFPEIRTDTAVRCGAVYCYRLQGTGTVGSQTVTVLTDSICVTAVSVSTPEGIRKPWATFKSQQVELFWTLPTAVNGKFVLAQRTTNGGLSRSLTFPFADSAIDQSTLNQPARYCYQMIVQDTCGNLSATSRLVCPVYLFGTKETRTTTLLNWTSYEGFDTTGFEYTLEKLDGSGNIIEQTDLGNNTFSFLDEGIETRGQVLRFRVRVTHPDPQFPLVYSNLATFDQLSTLFVPSAFSPNGDGVNDEFFVQGRFVADFQLTVFNKYGEIVYRSNRFDERWDGKFNGKVLPSDTYVFYLEATDEIGTPIKQRGTVSIIK